MINNSPQRLYVGLKRLPEAPIVTKNDKIIEVKTVVSSKVSQLILLWKAKVQKNPLAISVLKAYDQEPIFKKMDDSKKNGGLVQDTKFQPARKILLKLLFDLRDDKRSERVDLPKVEKLLQLLEWMSNEPGVDRQTYGRLLFPNYGFDSSQLTEYQDIQIQAFIKLFQNSIDHHHEISEVLIELLKDFITLRQILSCLTLKEIYNINARESRLYKLQETFFEKIETIHIKWQEEIESINRTKNMELLQ